MGAGRGKRGSEGEFKNLKRQSISLATVLRHDWKPWGRGRP